MAATDIERGLSTAEVEERIAAGKINRNMELKTKSVKELIIENLCTLFNLINVILAFLVILTGSFKNLTFLFVVFLNTAIGVIQSMRSKKMVDKLTLLTSKKAIAVRDGAEVELDLDQIVLDDIIRLGRGDQIPADAVVVSGEALVNESLLTGESDLIKKQPGSELMSGSFIDSGLLRARVIHVGADNYVAKINNEAKYVKKVNSEIMNALNAIVRFASIIMIPLGLALFASSVSELWDAAGTPGDSALSWCFSELLAGHVPSSALLSTVGALLGMIPQGLVLLTSSVLAIATVRLARRKVLTRDMNCIETLARVDTLCVDKTGTITESTMQADDPLPLAENTPITEILSAFYAGEQPDNDTARALTARFGQGGTAWAAVRTIPFNTAYKYSAKDFGAQGCYVVGAPDVLAGSRAGELADRLTPLLAQGRRVLLLAKYNGTLPDPPAALDPAQLEFLALLPLQNRIRESAPKTFRFFAKQGVKIKVISGDDPQAVSHVAANAGIAGAEHWVDAATLQSEAALAEAAEKCTVFGRVTPEQKRQLVHALQAKGHTVAMTGDGVNDVLALKDADCGIAMASGAQAASQVAQLVLLDSDFAALPGVVAEGRRVINNIQRSASLFLVKNIFSFLLSIVALALPLAYPFQPLQLSLVTFATIGAPAFFLALEPNHELVHGKFMRNVLRKALPGGLTDFLLVFCAQGFGYAFDIPSDMVGTICTLVILCVGLQILWGVCIPFTPLHWAIWGSMTVAGVGGVFLLARWLPLVRLDLGGTLVLVVLLALSAPTLAGLVFMGERLHGMVNDWKNKKARKHA